MPNIRGQQVAWYARMVTAWPTRLAVYAATIGSNFAARVVEMQCCACVANFDAHMARVSDPLLKRE